MSEALGLIETLRTTGAVRSFTDEPVADDVVWRILDTARFAPSGGNRQGWRVVVAREPRVRAGLREIYMDAGREYIALGRAGLVAWSPVADPEAERRALAESGTVDLADAGHFGELARNLDRVPVVLVLLADLHALAAADRDLGRYTLVGGASVYPFAWSILLAARAEGLSGVMTTMTTRREPAVRELLRVPPDVVVAATIMLGHPVRAPRRLRREPVSAFATVDTYDGPALLGPEA